MSSVFNYFCEIYCINLRHRKDRRVHMQSVFRNLGVIDRVTWFEAIKTPLDGKIGCRLSHLNIIKHAKENKLNNVLIFEDDITPTTQFNLNNLNESIDTLKSVDWDILYLGGRVVEPAVDISEFLFKSSLWSTGSLCINKNAFDRCLQMENYKGPVDWFYSSPMLNFNCYSVNPCMFVQHPKFDSDLTPETHDRRDVFVESYKNRHHTTTWYKEWVKHERDTYHDKSQ